MTKKKQVTIVAILIALAIFTTAGMTFAFWNAGYKGNTQNTSTKNTVNIGQAKVINTTLTLSDMGLASGGKLVPTSITPATGEVNELTYKMNVVWKSDSGQGFKGVTAPLNVEITDITDGTNSLSAADKALFDVTYGNPTVSGDLTTGTDVNFKIKMAEPADKAQYDRISNKNLTFKFKFSVADNV